MLWFKRILCGIYALFLLVWGVSLINNSNTFWFVLGCFIFIAGLTLAHITIKQQLPKYNFWITFIAICLAYALLVQKGFFMSDEPEVVSGAKVAANEVTAVEKPKPVVREEKAKPQKKKGFNLSAYPKISGSITVLHAHIFYIGGRYVRLYGVDAPDNDQLCSDANGGSYNCGETAASWVRNWVDKNPVDCYLLKIEPKGQDLATCIWGKYDIGAALVSAGWGVANLKETNIYKPYEVKARNASVGLWQGSFYLPEDWRNIKRQRNNFTVRSRSSAGGGLGLGSLF